MRSKIVGCITAAAILLAGCDKPEPGAVKELNEVQVATYNDLATKERPGLVALREKAFAPKFEGSAGKSRWILYCNLCHDAPGWERPRVALFLNKGVPVDTTFALELPPPAGSSGDSRQRCTTAVPLNEAINEFTAVSDYVKAYGKQTEIRGGAKQYKLEPFQSASGALWECQLHDYRRPPTFRK